MKNTCHLCGSTAVERDDVHGEAICGGCGAVLEHSGVVDNLQFKESGTGAVAMVGQFISADGGNARGFSLPFVGRESREQSIYRGNHAIKRVAGFLLLSRAHVESAQRIYFLALQRSFTIGRSVTVVAACCLYAVCRRDSTPHMLIDFADVTRLGVRALGQVFMKLVRVLRLQIPSVDPALFLERFVNKFPFGDHAHAIVMTGIRLVQAMLREGLSTGRRPVGICAAALLIAARYHNFQINSEDLVEPLRISASTINKRLNEFRLTFAATLTAEEFEATDMTTIPVQRGPPSLYRKKRPSDELDPRNVFSALTALARSQANDSEGVALAQSSDTESLSEISDSEISSYLLSETDRRAKELIWDQLTKDATPDYCRPDRQRHVEAT